MRRNSFAFTATSLIAVLSSLSLIASTSTPDFPVLSDAESDEVHMETLAPSSHDLEQDNTLLDASTDITIDSSEEDLEPPFEEADSNIEEQGKMASDPKLQPDVQKVLYDPKMNYGTGAPVPKPTPVTTVKRNLIVLGTSAILATVAMLIVSSGKGHNASH